MFAFGGGHESSIHPYVCLLGLLGLLVMGVKRAEASAYGYWANDPVRIDRGYCSPAWDHMAATILKL